MLFWEDFSGGLQSKINWKEKRQWEEQVFPEELGLSCLFTFFSACSVHWSSHRKLAICISLAWGTGKEVWAPEVGSEAESCPVALFEIIAALVPLCKWNFSRTMYRCCFSPRIMHAQLRSGHLKALHWLITNYCLLGAGAYCPGSKGLETQSWKMLATLNSSWHHWELWVFHPLSYIWIASFITQQQPCLDWKTATFQEQHFTAIKWLIFYASVSQSTPKPTLASVWGFLQRTFFICLCYFSI